MKAAQDFGLNAYYIAAKIRQENGGATASATAVNGSTSPFRVFIIILISVHIPALKTACLGGRLS